MADHGTYTRYRSCTTGPDGGKCDACKAANAKRVRDGRQAGKAETTRQRSQLADAIRRTSPRPPRKPQKAAAPSRGLVPAREPKPEPTATTEPWTWTAEVISSRPNVPDPPEPAAHPQEDPASWGNLLLRLGTTFLGASPPAGGGGRIRLSGPAQSARGAGPDPESAQFLAQGHAPGYRPDSPQLPPVPRREPVRMPGQAEQQAARRASRDSRTHAMPSAEVEVWRPKAPGPCPHGGWTTFSLARRGVSLGDQEYVCETCSRIPAAC